MGSCERRYDGQKRIVFAVLHRRDENIYYCAYQVIKGGPLNLKFSACLV